MCSVDSSEILLCPLCLRAIFVPYGCEIVYNQVSVQFYVIMYLTWFYKSNEAGHI